MTLTEIKKAAQNLSESDKKQLISFLDNITSSDDLDISEALKIDLDTIHDGITKGKISTRPYRAIRSDIRQSYGI